MGGNVSVESGPGKLTVSPSGWNVRARVSRA